MYRKPAQVIAGQYRFDDGCIGFHPKYHIKGKLYETSRTVAPGWRHLRTFLDDPR